MSPLLELRHIEKAYGDPVDPLHALHDISFNVERGELVCLVGPSGGGKSTLLRIIAGLLHPSGGEILLDGEAITSPSPRVGIVFQNVNLMPWRTVRDNIALPLELEGVPRRKRYEVAQKLVELVALQGFELHYPHQLSGGMQQRAAIARTLAQDPEILLLDEPFGALDALTREHLNRELLRIQSSRQQTIFMVTHAINEAVFLADRVLVLTQRPGAIQCEIPIPLARPRSEALFTDPQYLQLVSDVRAAIDSAFGNGLTMQPMPGLGAR
ncbi:MAG: ABC transporter ATP-binding protein [Caldilineales bacterium]|nr:ABC transporter ATP-binding protein [Caldilineales bacterium]